MPIETLKLTFAIFLPFITGFFLTSCLMRNEKPNYFLNLGLSYGIGTGVLAILMMILGALNLPFSYNIISAGMLTILAVSLTISLHTPQKVTCHPNITPNNPQIQKKSSLSVVLFRFFLIFIIALNLFFAFFRATNLPVLSWDSLATVAIKAKIFYFEGHLPHLNKLPHSTYPLLVPLNETWICLNLGYWSDATIKIIFPFLLVSFIFIIFAFLKELTNKTWALIGCTLLCTSDLLIYHATISYRDLFLTYYNCTVIMLLLLWLKNRSSSLLTIASLFAGFASFTKLEGTAFFLVYLGIFLFLTFIDKIHTRSQKIKNFFRFTLPGFIIVTGFNLYKIFNGVLQDGVGNNDKTALNVSIDNFKLLPSILKSFYQDMFITSNWGLAWIIFFISLMQLKHKKNTREIFILCACLLLYFGLYGSVALFTHNYFWISGLKSTAGLSRLLLHFFPLTILIIVLLNYPGTVKKDK